MINSVHSLQYSLLNAIELKAHLQQIQKRFPNSIVHTLNRSQDRKIESLFHSIENPVSTSAGYWTTADLKLADQPLRGKKAIRLKSGLFYSLDPDALRFQVNASLETTGRKQLEHLWIEDPDLIEQAEIPFFEIWQPAFQALEQMKAEGKIKNWGWLIRNPNFAESILEQMDHDPSSVQLVPKTWIIPFNPLELRFYPYFSDLKKHQIQLWIDRPFTAILQERLYPLVSTLHHITTTTPNRPNELLNSIESKLNSLSTIERQKNEPNGWATQIHEHWVQIPDFDRWKKLWNDQIEPALTERKERKPELFLQEYDKLFQLISEYFISNELEFIGRWKERWSPEWFCSSQPALKNEDLFDGLMKLYQKAADSNLIPIVGVLMEPEFFLNTERKSPLGQLTLSAPECLQALSK